MLPRQMHFGFMIENITHTQRRVREERENEGHECEINECVASVNVVCLLQLVVVVFSVALKIKQTLARLFTPAACKSRKTECQQQCERPFSVIRINK